MSADDRFMRNGKSANFLYNSSPLMTVYMIVSVIIFTKYMLFKYT